MRMKVVRSKSCSYWIILFDGWNIGMFRTPREAKHKARMWWMWVNTGDNNYLSKAQ